MAGQKDSNDVTIGRDYLVGRKTDDDIKKDVSRDAWFELHKYLNDQGNANFAKVSCVVIATLAKEAQAENNKRQLDMVEERLKRRGELPDPNNISRMKKK